MFHRDLPIRLHREPRQIKLSHEPTAKFGKFLMLPKELQLLIWEWFEVVNLRVRHTFFSINRNDYEYLDFSQASFAEYVWSSAPNFEDPESVPRIDIRRPRALLGFIDSAVARRYEIPLLRDTKWFRECYRSLPRLPPTKSYNYVPTWVNFKVDSFFFLPALHERRNRGRPPFWIIYPTDFFHCLYQDRQFVKANKYGESTFSLSDLNMTHWFWSIQNLELFIAEINTYLNFCDRHILGIHPALKSVKLLVTRTSLNCTHKTEDAHDDGSNSYNERVLHELKHDKRGLSDDLSAVLTQWNMPPRNICECGRDRKFLREVLEFRGEVCKLVKDRGVSVEIVAAGHDDPATLPVWPYRYVPGSDTD